MKKALLVLAFASVSAFAAEYSGTISDSHCGAKHIAATAADAACAQKCFKGGADAVLVTSNDTVLKIDAGSRDKVASFVGKKVTLKGTVSNGTLTVKSIE